MPKVLNQQSVKALLVFYFLIAARSPYSVQQLGSSALHFRRPPAERSRSTAFNIPLQLPHPAVFARSQRWQSLSHELRQELPDPPLLAGLIFLFIFRLISTSIFVTTLRNILFLQLNKYYTKLAIGTPAQNPPGRI